MSSRIVGYYLTKDIGVDTDNKILTRAKAIEIAKSLLGRNRRKVGIVRANDMILVMTISLNDDNSFDFNKK